MKSKLEFVTYSVSDLKDWLYSGKNNTRLSEKIITKTRAFAIINNPFVTEETVVLSVLFSDNEVAAYTAVFPDKNYDSDNPVYWCTTLFVVSKFEGKGYGYCVLSKMQEIYGNAFMDMEGVAATVQNFEALGYVTEYFPKFIFKRSGNIRKGASLRNILVKTKNIFLHLLNYDKLLRLKYQIRKSKYIVRNVNCVNSELYSFIMRNKADSKFLRQQESMNWILQFPFFHESPAYSRAKHINVFDDTVKSFRRFATEIIINNKTIGFTYLIENIDSLSVKYLYYDKDFESDVYLFVLDVYLSHSKNLLTTTDAGLASFLKSTGICNKYYTVNTSFSHSKLFTLANGTFQGADGDMFA